MINLIFLLKQLTQQVYDDSISDDTAPSSGSGELIKIETSNAIYFCHSNPILIILLSFDCKFNELSRLGFRIYVFNSQERFYHIEHGTKAVI